MPAKSKSQQRLFGMVHAYNKGEFRGSGKLRRRVAALSERIPDRSVRHFAETKHEGLKETKKAAVSLSPDQVQALYGYLPVEYASNIMTDRSKKRRTFLGSVLRGGVYGGVLGGLGWGALGAFLANKAAKGSGVSGDELFKRVGGAGLRMAAWGATRGAGIGAIGGGGMHVFNKIREGY